MKRYKLKKDLPTFKAGQVCWLGLDGQLLTRTEEGKIILVYNTIEMKKFPKILTEWFEEIPEETKTVYDLSSGDECWAVFTSDFGYVPKKIEFGKLAETLRQTGSLYLTREEAKQDIAWNMAREVLRRDTKGFKPDWTDDLQDRFCVSFYLFCGNRTKCHLGHLQVENAKWSITREIYFASQADAEASIKAHEKEWKIYLGVEE